MNVEMLPLEIVGLKTDLQAVLHGLRDVGCVHIDELNESPVVSARPFTLDREMLRWQEELGYLLARIEGLLDMLRISRQEPIHPENMDLETLRQGIEKLLGYVQALVLRRDGLVGELASLPRYEATLKKLLPMIPASSKDPRYSTIGILVSREHVGVLDSVSKRVLDMTRGRAEVVASDIDSGTRAMLIVFPDAFTGEIESLLGRDDVARLRMPAELGEGPPDLILESLHRRMTAIPEELARIRTELGELASQWQEHLLAWRASIKDELDTNRVISRFGETDMTFVLVGWVPAGDFERTQQALRQAVGERILVHRLPLTATLKKYAPVQLKNPLLAQPFESLVNLLALPRYGHIDPTRMMAVFLPVFFGMILGDVGYGVLLLVICLCLIRKFKAGVARDVIIVLTMGAGWSILFGFLYGEAFGTLGEQLGMHPLWFERADPKNVAGLLLMTIAVGAVHITLGLVLGVWEALRERQRNHLLERGGMLIGLVGLFLLVGTLVDYLPHGFMTPAIIIVILGIVILGASLGWLGILMGPIEFISMIGNILSYLRIAAIGLASVYLARVANDMAGMVGNLIVGIILAVLIHALNLVMGAFSPTIHSLRLHYVEFFRKFYEGGGRAYKPFQKPY